MTSPGFLRKPHLGGNPVPAHLLGLEPRRKIRHRVGAQHHGRHIRVGRQGSDMIQPLGDPVNLVAEGAERACRRHSKRFGRKALSSAVGCLFGSANQRHGYAEQAGHPRCAEQSRPNCSASRSILRLFTAVRPPVAIDVIRTVSSRIDENRRRTAPLGGTARRPVHAGRLRNGRSKIHCGLCPAARKCAAEIPRILSLYLLRCGRLVRPAIAGPVIAAHGCPFGEKPVAHGSSPATSPSARLLRTTTGLPSPVAIEVQPVTANVDHLAGQQESALVRFDSNRCWVRSRPRPSYALSYLFPGQRSSCLFQHPLPSFLCLIPISAPLNFDSVEPIAKPGKEPLW